MAKRLLGKEVNEALVASLQARAAALKEKGVTPTLAILRLGENPSDLSYEKGARVGVTPFSFRAAARVCREATRASLTSLPSSLLAITIYSLFFECREQNYPFRPS